MFARDHISVTRINLYRTCSLKYRFQYLDQLPRRGRPAGLVFGSAIHAALAWWHRARLAGDTPALADLLRLFEADWYAQTLDQPLLGADDAPERLLQTGRQLLAAFTRRPAAPVVAVEAPFEVPLVHPDTGETLPVPLVGVIDLIQAPDTIVEFKTALRRWSPADLPDHLQLSAYAYAYHLLAGRPAADLRLITLVRTRAPWIDEQHTARGAPDAARLFHLSRAVLRGIAAGVFFPNRGCWLCKDCEYVQDCREWSGDEPSPEATR
jgi:putative RecB family exonuclease